MSIGDAVIAAIEEESARTVGDVVVFDLGPGETGGSMVLVDGEGNFSGVHGTDIKVRVMSGCLGCYPTRDRSRVRGMIQSI